MPEKQPKRLVGISTIGPIHKFLFLALGLTRRWPPQNPKGLPLEEPNGARTSRRNIIALAGLLVLAGFAGADPSDLNVFGVKPGEGARGTLVISAAAVAVQLYWYYLRYCHLFFDARVFDSPRANDEQLTSIHVVTIESFEYKSADLFSNWVAFLLTVISWYFIGHWIAAAFRV